MNEYEEYKIEKCDSYDLGQLAKEIPHEVVIKECYRRGELLSIRIRKLENQLRLLNAEKAELARVWADNTTKF